MCMTVCRRMAQPVISNNCEVLTIVFVPLTLFLSTALHVARHRVLALGYVSAVALWSCKGPVPMSAEWAFRAVAMLGRTSPTFNRT